VAAFTDDVIRPCSMIGAHRSDPALRTHDRFASGTRELRDHEAALWEICGNMAGARFE
jgi:hypothetical protein